MFHVPPSVKTILTEKNMHFLLESLERVNLKFMSVCVRKTLHLLAGFYYSCVIISGIALT